MARIPEQELMTKIRAYCRATGRSETRFGAEAINDPSFVTDLRAGREVRQATRKRIESYMKKAVPRLRA